MAESPLDKLRDRLFPEQPPKNWDLDIDSDTVALRNNIVRFTGNLIQRTNSQTKMAYQICHYMEADLLEIDGLVAEFPKLKLDHKKKQRGATRKKNAAEATLATARQEIRILKEAIKKLDKADVAQKAEIREDILLNETQVTEAEREIARYNASSEYRPVYPLKDTKRSSVAKPEDWALLNTWFDKKVRSLKDRSETLSQNLELLCKHLGFSTQERDALLVIICCAEDTNFGTFIDNLSSRTQKNAHAIVARMIGIKREDLTKMLRPDSPLISKGLILPIADMDDFDREMDSCIPTISTELVNLLKEPDLTIDVMLKRMIGDPAKTDLEWDRDFPHLGKAGDELIRLLSGAVQRKIKGVNVLLHGTPGTGKTEALKAAAKKVGLELYLVGEKDSFGREPSRNDRLSAALLAQALLADKPNAAVMLDEMEDLFPSKSSFFDMFGGESNESQMGEKKRAGGASKVYLNRLLEENTTITLWTTNQVKGFDPAFRRRMLFSIEFKIPPAKVRERLWSNVAVQGEFNIVADAKGLAQDYVVPPGLMANAIKHASLSGGGKEAIVANLRAASSLVFGYPSAIDARERLSSEYDPRLLKAKVEASDFNLQQLGERIKASGRMNFSMLLYGPPGSGKSTYFQYLSQLLEMDLHIQQATTLMDKYVGETEKKIAEAFAEAEDRGLLLVIDEVDTFLRRRETLEQNWEISAVNQMLICMERHSMPFGCTTNLMANIDPAAKRRFLFKIGFDYLDPSQRQIAFEKFFNLPPPASLAGCPQLTPSDFAIVKRQLPFLEVGGDTDQIARLLTLEANSRKENESEYGGSNIGFGVNRLNNPSPIK